MSQLQTTAPTPGAPRHSVLIVDDDSETVGLLAEILEAEDFEVWKAFTAKEARALLAQRQPELVLLDVKLPDGLWWGAAAFSELLGSILVFLGLLTRLGAFLLACTMATAISTVLWPAGFAVNKGGYEYAMALLAMSLALMIAGGGMASIDRSLSSGRRR